MAQAPWYFLLSTRVVCRCRPPPRSCRCARGRDSCRRFRIDSACFLRRVVSYLSAICSVYASVACIVCRGTRVRDSVNPTFAVGTDQTRSVTLYHNKCISFGYNFIGIQITQSKNSIESSVNLVQKSSLKTANDSA